MQERRNSSALAMELRFSCINPSNWYCINGFVVCQTKVDALVTHQSSHSLALCHRHVKFCSFNYLSYRLQGISTRNWLTTKQTEQTMGSFVQRQTNLWGRHSYCNLHHLQHQMPLCGTRAVCYHIGKTINVDENASHRMTIWSQYYFEVGNKFSTLDPANNSWNLSNAFLEWNYSDVHWDEFPWVLSIVMY